MYYSVFEESADTQITIERFDESNHAVRSRAYGIGLNVYPLYR